MQPVACNMQMFPRFVRMCLRWMDTSVAIPPPPSGSLKNFYFPPPATFSFFCETLKLMIAHTGSIVQLVYEEESGMPWRRELWVTW